MLDLCGAKSILDLYADVPEQLRLNRDYNLPKAQDEQQVRRQFAALSNSNLACFAGAGAYAHFCPAVIDSIVSRSEYLTSYTPYQSEISQGTLQYIFEYQSMLAQLTAMDICNASMYDGATATAEAMIMAVNATRKRRRALISATLNPDIIEVMRTYARYHRIDIDIIPEANGNTDLCALDNLLQKGDVAAVVLPQPNYYGIIEDLSGVADKVHAAKALLVINAPASPLAVIRPAGEWGADIAVGDAQSLGMPLSVGGPYLGYMCCTKALMRKIPGRIVGATTDKKGQRTFVLTLQAREQHIRREKATSNICSNQGVMTLRAAIYLALLGYEGLRQVNAISADKAHRLADALCATGKAHLAFPDKPFLNEFALDLDGISAHQLIDALIDKNILAGVAIAQNRILVAATECCSEEDINTYVSTLSNL